MSRRGPLNTLLFWLMLLLGAAALVPCLVLPPWLERQAQAECLRAHREYIARLEQRLLMAQKQIEHLNKDPSYVLRLAERDLGGSVDVPGTRTVRVEPSPATDQPPEGAAARHASTGGSTEQPPDVADFVEWALERYPQTRVFVHRRTRPIVMALGGGLILAAIVLVAFGGQTQE